MYGIHFVFIPLACGTFYIINDLKIVKYATYEKIDDISSKNEPETRDENSEME